MLLHARNARRLIRIALVLARHDALFPLDLFGVAPISRRFAVLNAKLLMFHALHALRDHAYEIPELECVVFYKREKRCLQVLDLVGARVLTLEQLYPYLAAEDDQLIEFHFSSDRMGVEGTRLVPWPQDNCFVKGSFPLERPVFPFTAKA